MNTHAMTNIQLELLKMYSTDIPEKELIEVKSVLAKFFANKAISAADKEWEKKNLSNDDMNAWLVEK